MKIFTFKNAVLLWVLAVIVVVTYGSRRDKVEPTPDPAPETPTVELPEVPVYLPEDLVNQEAVFFYPVPLDDDTQIHIIRTCEDRSLDPAIIFAMIDRESDFDAATVGDGGNSFGLMQVQPQWHQERMDKLGVTDLLDPVQNITVGIDYLVELLDGGKGLEWALAAYNAGATGANNGHGKDYAAEVMSTAEALTGVIP